MFPENHEAVFGVYFMLEAIGWIVSLSYSVYLTTFVKHIVLLFTLFISALGYYLAEILHRKQLKRIPPET